MVDVRQLYISIVYIKIWMETSKELIINQPVWTPAPENMAWMEMHINAH